MECCVSKFIYGLLNTSVGGLLGAEMAGDVRELEGVLDFVFISIARLS